MKIILTFLLFIFIFSPTAHAQDTLKIYFDFGSSKVDKEYYTLLDNIPTDYNLSLADSIHFIGYADSIGKLESNLNLSMKRAKNTLKYCRKIFDKETVISLLAKGEGKQKDGALNRRVEIIFYYPKEEENAATEIITADPKCFLVDVDALAYCHIRQVKNKKKDMVYIEAMDLDYFRNTKHYYVKKANGKASAQRIKWKLQQTGSFWWKKKRLVATIPQKSFDQFQFFTLQNAPCDGCSEKIFPSDTIIMDISQYYIDHFLLDNMELKVHFFGGHVATLRFPKEYVDTSIDYYYIDRTDHQVPVVWEIKNGKRKQNYAYTKLPIVDNKIPVIWKIGLTTKCYSASTGLPNKKRRWIGCGGMRGTPEIEFQVNLEPGVFYHNDTVTGFLALGISYTTKNSYTSITSGINTHMGFYGSLRYQYHFFSFPFWSLSPGNNWSQSSENVEINRYGRIYAGTELKTSYNKKYQSFLEGNVHLGILHVNTKRSAFVPRIYLQSGIAYDALNRINQSPYGFVQLGLIMNLNSFFIKTK